MLIDTHFHLDLMDNMQSLIQEFKSSNNISVIAVGTTPKAYVRERQFCSRISNIKVGLGLHPQLVADRGQEIELFMELVNDATYIGEIGLDFNSMFLASKAQQLSCFRKIVIACAEKGGKTLSIHSVRSVEIVLDELEMANTFNNCCCILHWFTGKPKDLKRAIDDGAFFSINPRMIRTKSGQEAIKKIPSDRLLLETDSPFTMKFCYVEDLKKELDNLVDSIASIRGDDNVRKIIEDNNERIMSNVRSQNLR